jgi:hypothetical protein
MAKIRGYVKYGSVMLYDGEGNMYQIPLMKDGTISIEDAVLVDEDMLDEDEIEDHRRDGEFFAVDLPDWDNAQKTPVLTLSDKVIKVYTRAAKDLGPDLGGGGLLDLAADNLPGSLYELRVAIVMAGLSGSIPRMMWDRYLEEV